MVCPRSLSRYPWGVKKIPPAGAEGERTKRRESPNPTRAGREDFPTPKQTYRGEESVCFQGVGARIFVVPSPWGFRGSPTAMAFRAQMGIPCPRWEVFAAIVPPPCHPKKRRGVLNYVTLSSVEGSHHIYNKADVSTTLNMTYLECQVGPLAVPFGNPTLIPSRRRVYLFIPRA